MKTTTRSEPEVDVPRLVRLDISVAKDGSEIWRRTLNPDGGISRRNAEELRVVVAALEDALIQARADLGSVDPDVVSDVGSVALSNVDGDVPVSRMGSGDPNGKMGVKSSVIGATPAPLETGEVGVVGEHDVALGVAVNDDNVSRVQMLAGVDELHGGDVGSEDSLANVEFVHPSFGGSRLLSMPLAFATAQLSDGDGLHVTTC